MTANELRIGNLVAFEFQNKSEVHKIIPKDIYVMNQCEIEYGQESECYKPIMFTEEWHNKFGEERNGFNSFEYNLTHRKKVVFTGDYIYLLEIDSVNGKESIEGNICTLWNNDSKRRSIYVHEWQNLYFALNGEELEIRKEKS